MDQGIHIGAKQQGERAADDHEQDQTAEHGGPAGAALSAEHGFALCRVRELRADAADLLGGTLAVEPLACLLYTSPSPRDA